ncbi:MAG TPA: DNA polymerase III subunit delta [Tissierellia bacterium]|nr:DNA polymerase III subunit delta [Tissierellia bacterium]
MRFEDFIKDMREDKIKPVYLFYGEEDYLIDYSIKSLKEKYVNEGLETLNYIVLDGDNIEMSHIYDACETLPFMSEKKVVIIKNLGIFGSKTKGQGAEYFNQKKDELKKYISTLEDYICLVFVEKNTNIDKRKGIIKSINKFGRVIEFTKLKGRDLNNWIGKAFKKYGKIISYNNINYFIQHSSYFDRDINKSLYDLENEIIKLVNFTGDRKEINVKDIDEVMTKSLDTNIFNLLNSIGEKDINNSLKVFHEMCVSNEPIPLILYMIIRQLRLILMLKLLKEKGYDKRTIMGKLRIGDYQYKIFSNQSKNFSNAKLEESLNLCLESDENIKTGVMDDKLALEMLIVRMCS